jgi:hypothetical protein
MMQHYKRNSEVSSKTRLQYNFAKHFAQLKHKISFQLLFDANTNHSNVSHI